MKTRFSTISILTLLSLLFHFQLQAQEPAFELKKVDKIIQKSDLQLKPMVVSPVAQRAIQRGVTPGAFKNVTYNYTDRVTTLSPATRNMVLNSISNNGTIETKEDIQLQANKIYVDEDSDIVLQAAPITGKDLIIYKPKFEEVFQDFNLPLQTVPINLANTSYTMEGSQVSDRETGANYDVLMTFDNTEYEHEEEIKNGDTKQTVKLIIKLNGFVGFNKPTVEARYTKYDGYKLVYKAQEKVDLKIESDVKFTSLTRIPLWAFDIPAGKIGNCKLGVFAVIDINGDVTLELDIDQGIDFEAGVQGKTFFYAPRSVSTVNNTTSYCNVEYEIEGKIKAFGGVECVAQIKVKGYDILKLRGKGGIEANVETTNNGRDYKADMGFRIVLDGNVKKIDKDFTLLDKYITVWEKSQKNFGGYILQVKGADAYYDRVHGEIFKKNDSTPYQNKNITLLVEHPNKANSTYQGTTNDNGVFAMTDIDLKKGDKVRVQIEDSPNPSEPVLASIPFKEIKLQYADYYIDQVEGVINSKIITFPKQSSSASTASNPAIQGSNIPNVNINNPSVGNNSVNVKPQIKLDYNAFKNSITYNGDVQIIVEPTVHKFEKKIPLINSNNSKPTIINKKDIKLKQSPIGTKPKVNAPKAVLNKTKNIKTVKVTNKPFGAFRVDNVVIHPSDKVKARVNIDGFILESEWIMADGLIISQIFDHIIAGGIYKKSISADNSWLFVSALRSELKPTGTIKLLKGIDMQHSSLHKDFPTQTVEEIKLKEFKNVQHPIVYFNKECDLEAYFGVSPEFDTSNKEGLSIAKTGNWTTNNMYYNPKDLVSLNRKSGHPFEFASYTFEGMPIIYKFHQENCASCNTVDYESLKDLHQERIKTGDLNFE